MASEESKSDITIPYEALKDFLDEGCRERRPKN
jgi:hypothetical protein